MNGLVPALLLSRKKTLCFRKRMMLTKKAVEVGKS